MSLELSKSLRGTKEKKKKTSKERKEHDNEQIKTTTRKRKDSMAVETDTGNLGRTLGIYKHLHPNMSNSEYREMSSDYFSSIHLPLKLPATGRKWVLCLLGGGGCPSSSLALALIKQVLTWPLDCSIEFFVYRILCHKGHFNNPGKQRITMDVRSMTLKMKRKGSSAAPFTFELVTSHWDNTVK